MQGWRLLAERAACVGVAAPPCGDAALADSGNLTHLINA